MITTIISALTSGYSFVKTYKTWFIAGLASLAIAGILVKMNYQTYRIGSLKAALAVQTLRVKDSEALNNVLLAEIARQNAAIEQWRAAGEELKQEVAEARGNIKAINRQYRDRMKALKKMTVPAVVINGACGEMEDESRWAEDMLNSLFTP